MNKSLIFILLILLLCALYAYYWMVNRETARKFNLELERLRSTLIRQKENKLDKWRKEIVANRNLICKEEHLIAQREQRLTNYYQNELLYNNYKLFLTKFIGHSNWSLSQWENETSALSQKERTILLLCLLTVPDQDIRLLMNYSYSSLPTIKARMLKKMGVGSISELEKG